MAMAISYNWLFLLDYTMIIPCIAFLYGLFVN